MQKNTIISIVISLALIGGAIYFASDKSVPTEKNGDAQLQNVEIRDGVQYATITAKGGYAPRLTQVKSGIPTKLVVRTDGTYDCSISLAVRAVGFQKILKSTGEEIIDLGTLESGQKIQGICGMGMYNFLVEAL